MDTDEPIEEIVRRGYDAIADRYLAARRLAARDSAANLAYLDALLARLPPEPSILDLGCGAGIPIDEYLVARGCTLTGIDISERQIELARANVPQGRYEIRDMSSLLPGEYQVDGIVSFYAIFHTPRERHAQLFRTVSTYLPDDSRVLVSMGAGDWEGIEHDYHGDTMAWSHYGSAKNRAMLECAGFEIELDEIDRSETEVHQILLARKR